MSIVLTQNIRVAGVVRTPSEGVIGLGESLEAELIARGAARAVTVEPSATAAPATSVGERLYIPALDAHRNLNLGPLDKSGRNLHCTLSAGLSAANCWANAGYASSLAAANGNFYVPRANWPLDITTDAFVIAMTVNLATPASLTFFAGNSTVSNPDRGIVLGSTSGGPLRLYVRTDVNSYDLGSLGVIADAADHDIVIAGDWWNKSIYVWIDGALVLSKLGAWAGTDGVSLSGFCFGQGKVGGATGLAVKFKEIALWRSAFGTLPNNLAAAATAYHATKQDIVPLLALPKDRVGLFVLGQSNESGQGVTAGTNTGAGHPIQDPTKPYGQSAKRSYYPSMAAALGAKSVWLDIGNYGRGGASVRECFVGNIRPWANGMYIKRGSYITSNGGLWRSNIASFVTSTASTVAPAGTADTTGADTIPWVYVRAATDADVGLQSPASPLFDPNGELAAIAAAAAAYPGRKWFDFAIGQTDGDANYATTRLQFSTCLQYIAQWAQAVGFEKIFLGFTCSGDTPMNAVFDSTLIPGLQDALAALAGNPKVVAGINVRAALGALPTSPVSGIGLQADAAHMNDAGYDAAGAIKGAQLAAYY